MVTHHGAAAAPQFRGRVTGVRMLAIYGHPVGLLAAGALIEHIGPTASATLCAAADAVLILLVVVHWRADVLHPPEPSPGRWCAAFTVERGSTDD